MLAQAPFPAAYATPISQIINLYKYECGIFLHALAQFFFYTEAKEFLLKFM